MSIADQQTAIYGRPLAEWFADLRGHYDISQRRLAQVLGLSAPMLSQLATAQRVKIGNPSVHERLLLLDRLMHAGAEPTAAMAQVEAAEDAVTTSRSAVPVFPGPDAAASLAASVPLEELRAALDRCPDLSALAGVLRRAIDSSTRDSPPS